MPPPTRPPDSFTNAVLHAFEQSEANSSNPGPSQAAAISTEHVSGKSVSEAELDLYIAAQSL
eukprot:1861301-Pleurochrysis_carterae.AAC.1